MTPYYSDDWLIVYQGDCREVMASMDPESVQCVVTSPPYWGLRDYGDAGQLGLEPTPEAYVASMVEVFREVRRVLRDDGTLWLNLGDSYASGEIGRHDAVSPTANGPTYRSLGASQGKRQQARLATGLKHKDLVGIPWRVAFALQADGWYLRSDIIWSKPNPMPESVTDRPTKSHEYLFLLSKSARYRFDAAAVAERVTDSTITRLSQATLDEQHGSDRIPGKTNGPMKAVGKLTSAYSPPGQPPSSNARPTWQDRKAAGAHAGGHGPGQIEGSGTQRDVHGEGMTHNLGQPGTRNIRSVWTIATQPYPGAHFATFPPKLVEPCVKAGCPAGGAVLDPFAGSGTTGMVAQALGRRAVLIDLNGEYLTQAMRRNQQSPLGLDVA